MTIAREQKHNKKEKVKKRGEREMWEIPGNRKPESKGKATNQKSVNMTNSKRGKI